MYRALDGINESVVLNTISDLQEDGISGLALVPMDGICLSAKIDELTNSGIPVVTFHADLPQSRRLCYVGLDNMQSGRIAACLMGFGVPAGGTILPLAGFANHPAHCQRIDGFMDECTISYPQLDVLPLQCVFDRDMDAYEITLRALQTFPNLSGIFIAANGVDSVCAALSDVNTKKHIHILTYGLTMQNKIKLQQKQLDMVIFEDAVQQGSLPLTILCDLLSSGNMPPNEFNYTNAIIKTRCNC